MVGSEFSSPPVVAAVGEDSPPDGATLAAGALPAGAVVAAGLGELELQAVRPTASPRAPITAAMRTFFVIPLPLSVSCGT